MQVLTVVIRYHIPAPTIHGIAMADSTLINGLGRYPGGPKTDLAVVNVQKGKRYRFRIFAMSCEPNFTFSVDGHNLTIIEADSKETECRTVNSVQLLAGMHFT